MLSTCPTPVMVPAVCSILCLLQSALCNGPSARAQEVAWRKDYGSALQEALEKKRPLVLDFGSQDCFWCRKLDDNTFRDAAVVALMNGRFIPVKIAAEQYQSLVQHLNIQSFPTLVVASPAGKILTTQVGFLEAARFLDFLQGGLARATEAAPSQTATATDPAPPWMLEDYDTAAGAIGRSEYARAVPLLKTIVTANKNYPVQKKAARLLKDLEEQAAARLSQVKEMGEAGRALEALQAGQELVRLYDGTAAAAAGLAMLSSLNARLDVKSRERLRQARELLLQAQEEFRTEQYLTCLLRCETLAGRFTELPEAAEAAELANKIKSNPERMQQLCDRVPELLGMLYLSTAEAKLKQGQPQQAVFLLERILQAFPNSRHADLAQVRLSQIQGPPALPVSEEKKQ